MENQNASYWINRLQLQPHPEGGYYREVYRSAIQVGREGESNIKQACTTIYYLLAGEDHSAFHRLKSDEIWYFHKGQPLHIHVIDQMGKLITHELSDTATGELSVVIPPNVWFGAELPGKSGFTLVSCAVAPGFDFAEFEMADTKTLAAECPQHQDIIVKLSR